ncbi:hypothetical protein EIL87_11880 [Saccharopolyspora rhizosphaerae]|uniref:MaoC-like domain-containing protein n=1 Tax=Saccharopolyspora rhizosphaerae TaxID=2492662 RepID=A0A3R8Q4V8_9PSEU|nr:hypothetical protein [Saccharopolyspora rhizosphaerae]RRO16973.1 hypothetical protein EIL87_11880 [Saccharopolyspora rhizosphaerae]
MTARHFEDFRVGQHHKSGPREVTERDLAAFTEVAGSRDVLRTDSRPDQALPGPFGLAAFTGILHELAEDEAVVALLDTHWHYLAPIRVGDTVRFEMTTTRCRRTAEGDRGVVNRHVALLNQRDELVQEGTAAVLVRARDTDGTSDSASHAFGTVGWATALAERLGDDERFTSATSSWDGTIGLRCGEDEVHLRLYRGQVIDVARRSPLGATFSLGAGELVWTELITGPSNDLVHRAMRGQFEVSGNGYEYLRLTKVLHLIVDNARALAAGAER